MSVTPVDPVPIITPIIVLGVLLIFTVIYYPKIKQRLFGKSNVEPEYDDKILQHGESATLLGIVVSNACLTPMKIRVHRNEKVLVFSEEF